MYSCLASFVSVWTFVMHFAARSAHYLTPVIGQLVWPSVVIYFLWRFRHAIGALINSSFHFKGGGIEILADRTGDLLAANALENDLGPLTPGGNWAHQVQAEIEQGNIDPQKFSDIYYFSHDLLLSYFVLILEGEPEVIVHTLTCAVVHLENLGLKGTLFDKGLLKILEDAKRTDAAGWTPKLRRQESRKLWIIARTIGDGLERLQRTRGTSVG
jgi:hypothetical protein